MKHTPEQLALANEFIKRANIGGLCHALEGGVMEMNSVLVDFLNYAGGQLTFVKTAYTEQTGGGIMNDQLHLINGKLLVISDDLVCLYDNKEQYNTGTPSPQTIYLDEMPLPDITKVVKPDMYLLFGKEVCEVMAEDGIDEACNLINDGTEYSIMKTDGSNLSAILGQLEEYRGYCFLTLDEYNKILDI